MKSLESLSIWSAEVTTPFFHKDLLDEKVTIYFPIFYLVKSSANVLFFTCILPDYVAHKITKEF